MNDQAASPGCPDLETLTAVFDGEHRPDETVRAHLSACPDCARRLADYAVLRGHVSRLVASEPDEGFNARISAFVRAEAAKDAPRFSVTAAKRDFSDSRAAWIFRIAALFILSGFFVYLLMDQMHADRRPSGTRTYAVTETSYPSSIVKIVCGRPVWLLRLPTFLCTRYRVPSIAAIISLVVVFPTLPVSTITGIVNCSR